MRTLKITTAKNGDHDSLVDVWIATDGHIEVMGYDSHGYVNGLRYGLEDRKVGQATVKRAVKEAIYHSGFYGN